MLRRRFLSLTAAVPLVVPRKDLRDQVWMLGYPPGPVHCRECGNVQYFTTNVVPIKSWRCLPCHAECCPLFKVHEGQEIEVPVDAV